MRAYQLARQMNRVRVRLELEEERRRQNRKRLPYGFTWMAENMGHYLKARPSLLHLDLAADLRDLHLRRGSRLNRSAPRGGGKSSWSTKGYGTYCAVEGIEKYILILSETMDQACQFVEDIRLELESNEAVARNYPESTGVGLVWQRGKLKLRNGVMIQAKGVGGKIRGAANKADRPSLIIVDDPNGEDDAFSPTKRKRKLTWFTKAVLNMGDPRTNVIVLGTPIHRDAIVCQLRDSELSAGWESKSYRSVLRWPDRMDLWGHWEQLRSNLGDKDRAATSDRFFEANKDLMLKGAEVLWPDWEPFEMLMKHRVSVGPAAFACEKDDQPGTEGASEWPPEWFDDPALWFFEWPALTHKVMILDPSKGSGDKPGDYQAHVMLGLGADGKLYLDAQIVRENVGAMVTRGLDLCREWQPNVWSFEDNGTMGLLFSEVKRQIEERAQAGKPQLAPFEAYTSSDAKASRIRYCGAYLSRGQIRVRNTPGGRLLVEQLRSWPNGDHDDGPDAAGSAIRRMERLVNQGK